MRTARIGQMLAAGMLFAGVANADTGDASGGKDLPMITRYPGSVIRNFDTKAFDQYELVVGPCKGKACKTRQLEGKISWVEYAAPSGRSILEVFKNFEQAFKSAGFQTLFSCHFKECGDSEVMKDGLGYVVSWNFSVYDNRYLAAKLSRPTGDLYAAVNVEGQGGAEKIHVMAIELKPMEGGLVTVTAAGLADELTKTGHSALYGIYFDTGKAEVKPESEATLAEVVKLMQQNAGMKLIVAGHTDNVGEFASNMDLSKRRAEAVVKALTAKGVAAARLNPQGLGPCAPVSSNKDEAGRGRNRRVELVEQ